MTMSLAQIDAAMQEFDERVQKLGVRDQLDARFDISWIFHDNALEGLVLTYTELRSATDERVISDSTLIPFWDDVRNHKAGIALVRELSRRKKSAITLETFKKIHQTLTPEVIDQPARYRRDHPIHRLYFHEIAPPEKISYRLRRLVAWLAGETFRNMHPIRRASLAHLRLMRTFPWPKNSGRVARLLMNLLLLRDGYIPAIMHSIDRQRYYESLRVSSVADDDEDEDEADALNALVVEALAAGIHSARRTVDELAAAARRVRAA